MAEHSVAPSFEATPGTPGGSSGADTDHHMLVTAFSLLKGRTEIENFLADFFSVDELDKFARRWRVFLKIQSYVKDGQRPNRAEINRHANGALATITRVARVLRRGTGVAARVAMLQLTENNPKPVQARLRSPRTKRR